MPGIGVPAHFAGELLKQRAGIDFATVTYRGTPAMLTDLAGGQLDFIFGTPSSVMGVIEGGLVRPLAVTAPRRMAALSAVPTTEEAGLPDLLVSEWYGIGASSAMTAPTVARLNAAIEEALAEPELQEWLRVNSVTRGANTPEAFTAFVFSELAKFVEIARVANIGID